MIRRIWKVVFLLPYWYVEMSNRGHRAVKWEQARAERLRELRRILNYSLDDYAREDAVDEIKRMIADETPEIYRFEWPWKWEATLGK